MVEILPGDVVRIVDADGHVSSFLMEHFLGCRRSFSESPGLTFVEWSKWHALLPHDDADELTRAWSAYRDRSAKRRPQPVTRADLRNAMIGLCDVLIASSGKAENPIGTAREGIAAIMRIGVDG